jgi:hypothetical protein
VPDTPHLAPEAAAPVPAAPPTHAAPTHSLVANSGEQCPSCGTHVAPDQRYCLACGARCGEPRLPFMSAVTFMDAMKTPAGGASSSAPPRRPQRRISSNTALFATIGILLLAMGVGVLIGRSGNHSVATAPQAAPIVIHGGGEEASTEVSGAETGKTGGSGSPKKASKKVLKKEASSQGDTENILHAKVPLVKAGTQIGGACEEGAAGCKGKKFTGEFFGE